MDIKGYTYGYKSKRKSLVTDEAKKSRQLLIETGINWVCLAFSIKIKNYHSTEILFDFANDPTDLEILKVIKDNKRIPRKRHKGLPETHDRLQGRHVESAGKLP